MTDFQPIKHDPFKERRSIVLMGLVPAFVIATMFGLFKGFVAYTLSVLVMDSLRKETPPKHIDPEKLKLLEKVSVEDFKRYINSKRHHRLTAVIMGAAAALFARMYGHIPLAGFAAGYIFAWFCYPFLRVMILDIPGPKLIRRDDSVLQMRNPTSDVWNPLEPGSTPWTMARMREMADSHKSTPW